MTLVLHYAARSDRGLVRSNNQDSVYAGPRLLALADGMGGHAAGEVASKVVVAALAPLDDDEPSDDLLGQLRDAVLAGNSAISELVSEDPELEGMGTTLTAALFAGSKLGLVHIGDSRAYLVRDGELTQITHDDTFVQSLIDEGRITEEEAANHPQRSLLLHALTGHEVEPSLAVREARAGDRYLLCSDGLTGPVSTETIREALRIPDPQQCADRLIELSLKGGAPDNVTVIVADVADVEFGENAPIVGGAAGNGDEHPQPDSSAARASAVTQPQQAHTPQSAPTAPPPEAGRRRRRWLAPLLVLCGVLVALAGIALVGRWWVTNQYYIGVNRSDEVVIYQGIQGSAFGMSLSRQVEGSCPADAPPDCEPIEVGDVQEAQRPDLRNGITEVGDLQAAREAIVRLRTTALLPECPTPKPPEQQPGDRPPNGDRNGGDRPQNGTAPPPEPGQQDPQAPDPNAADEPTPLQTEEYEPGVTCRTVS
ncbi:protein phosphatase 2C domain-containing protein [Salinifilum aidingensis]